MIRKSDMCEVAKHINLLQTVCGDVSWLGHLGCDLFWSINHQQMYLSNCLWKLRNIPNSRWDVKGKENCLDSPLDSWLTTQSHHIQSWPQNMKADCSSSRSRKERKSQFSFLLPSSPEPAPSDPLCISKSNSSHASSLLPPSYHHPLPPPPHPATLIDVCPLFIL